jgi:hypothetical protein
VNAAVAYASLWVLANQVGDALPMVEVFASFDSAKTRAKEMISEHLGVAPNLDGLQATIDDWKESVEDDLTLLYDEDESACVSLGFQHVQP